MVVWLVLCSVANGSIRHLSNCSDRKIFTPICLIHCLYLRVFGSLRGCLFQCRSLSLDSIHYIACSSYDPHDAFSNLHTADTPIKVIDYLAKKGYSRTEAMLRMESANQEIDGRPLPPLGEDARPKYRMGFGKRKLPHLERLPLADMSLQICSKSGLKTTWTSTNLS